MDKKTKGAWLLHHTHKLHNVTSQQGFENTFIAGKAGILLSAISKDDQSDVDNERLNVLAKASNISTAFELPVLIKVLSQQGLIDKGNNGISVLGVTTASTLQHATDIFNSLNPSSSEQAVIDLAERASTYPVLVSDVYEEIGDNYRLAKEDLDQLFDDSEKIGFVDTEKINKSQTLLFNGNLFRRGTTQKIKLVLDALNTDEQEKINELRNRLQKSACVSLDEVKNFLGDNLFNKVSSIGLFDISFVSNSTEKAGFVTLPSAFSKYSNSMVEDAFDLAKAFVSSITYGMTKSNHERGKIQMVEALLKTLVRGESVGPVNAIAEDYKILELKGVVAVKHGSKKGRTGPMLSLLKKEIGVLALQVIEQGDISEHSLSMLPTAAVTEFNGPEANRERVRRKQIETNARSTNDMLFALRTGGGL